MQIREGNDSVEITCTERGPDYLPSAGDVKLHVTVHAQGFSGNGWTWIHSQSLRTFVERLQTLDASRNGTAEVQSISPNQFRLRVFTNDGWGHVKLAGRIVRDEQALAGC